MTIFHMVYYSSFGRRSRRSRSRTGRPYIRPLSSPVWRARTHTIYNIYRSPTVCGGPTTYTILYPVAISICFFLYIGTYILYLHGIVFFLNFYWKVYFVHHEYIFADNLKLVLVFKYVWVKVDNPGIKYQMANCILL